ncbi:oligopeptide/dipeptide ABC transporter ATP-binding protein [Microbacterium sp. TPD7012]|uniref:ABC transporter ATP-binding protein n=1 Tax=Microbacterium sp. TPD7012 TaxID=2171975 RepID=UPI000D51BA8E|nr:oligopeptide/dipeptide ABC transporter ATP-binding protein [Microbacterium sp. TPD7012]PVE96919.1 peptide ABC transporter ATP-binding protein [Microbacterium sp. TPD7012]
MKKDDASEILSVENLSVTYRAPRGQTVSAVDGVSFSVREREALGIIGESGCGKTTTGKTIAQLEHASGGRISFRGEDLGAAKRSRRHQLRRNVQFVFQDPHSSLNPRMTVQEIVAEPLRAFGMWHGTQSRKDVERILDGVGLPQSALNRYPHEFSGGQRQRIGIARGLALDPDLLILDEPVSALDVSIQAQVLNLLMDLRHDRDLSYIMISHDLDVVRHVADRVLVMYLGTVVEQGPVSSVLSNPAHPYTAALASATPSSDPTQRRERIVLTGDVPSPINPPSGCRFRTRCWRADEKCAQERPELTRIGQTDRTVACFYPLDVAIDFRRSGA